MGLESWVCENAECVECSIVVQKCSRWPCECVNLSAFYSRSYVVLTVSLMRFRSSFEAPYREQPPSPCGSSRRGADGGRGGTGPRGGRQRTHNREMPSMATARTDRTVYIYRLYTVQYTCTVRAEKERRLARGRGVSGGESTAHVCYDIICDLGAAAPPPPGRAGVICCWRKSRSWRGSPSVRRAT